MYPWCLSCAVTQLSSSKAYIFCCSAVKSSTVSLTICPSGCTRGLMYWWGYTLQIPCSRQSLSHEVLQLYCCNSWRTTLTILYWHQSKIRLSLCRTYFSSIILHNTASAVVGSLHICPWSFPLLTRTLGLFLGVLVFHGEEFETVNDFLQNKVYKIKPPKQWYIMWFLLFHCQQHASSFIVNK